jgi:hypothetical protein
MLSRFLKFYLKEYSLEEFNMIATNIVTDRFNRTQEFAKKIAAGVWYKMNSKDIRDRGLLLLKRKGDDKFELHCIMIIRIKQLQWYWS